VTTRPERLVLVTGTGPEVGKTWVAERDEFNVVVDGADVVAAVVGWPDA
jgi:hypothetical protein